MSLTNEFTKGIIRENPLFRLVLGTCPSLAITTSVDNGLGMGVGFTLALVLLSTVREVLGAGTFYGIPVLPENVPAIMMILPPGGFITLGCLLGLLNKMQKKAA